MRHRASLLCLVLISSLAIAAGARGEGDHYVVEEVSLSQVAEDLAAGKTSSVELTQAYLARIEKYDEHLNAVVAIAPDALEQARASDRRRAQGKALGPLDGVPILLKDNIDAAGMPTTAGSYALEANVPAEDSEVVERLRAAGAVILGKLNMSQWAGFRNTVAFNGSTVGGSPRNPYNLSHSPGGSSSGSGVATAVSFAAGTIGTDTGGSITGPASENGIVGLRPTVALISRRGTVPISLTQDTAGPMTRSVRDTAMLLNVIAGSDPADPASREADSHKTDYVKGLRADALKGVRLGVLHIKAYSEQTERLFEEALAVLAAQGAELVQIPSDIFEDLIPEQRVILLHDFKADVNAYLAGTPAAVSSRTLADLIEFNKTDPRESMHSQDLFLDSQATTGGRESPDYTETKRYAQRQAGARGIDLALARYDVSALVVPTASPADLIVPDGTDRSHPVDDVTKGARQPSATTYAAVAGYPHLSVPMGLVDDLPVGLSFIGTAWSEPMLLSLGYAYEQASQARVTPTAYKQAGASSYVVEEVSLEQLSKDLASGKTTSVEVTRAYLARIKDYDDLLNAVISVAPDALQQAAASDQRRARGRALGDLDGVPVLLKDNIDAVGMATTAGSYLLENNMPAQDSAVAERLRAAGVVTLGKANMSQWAGFRTTKGFNGSTVGGSTRNPYDLSRSACGSSSGSGIAGAVSFAAATVGTETSGSIVCPSAYSGLVGMKPTIALVSRRGIVPIGLTQDSAGPMTRTVADAAMLLTVMAGSDPADPWSEGADAHKANYVQGLNADALRGKRLGVIRDLREYDEQTTAVFDEALRVLAAQGARLVDIADSGFVDMRPEMRVILLHDFKEDLNAYLAGTPSSVEARTLADLITLNEMDARESMHGQDLFIDAQATQGGRENPGYIETLAAAKRITREEGIDRLLHEYNLDALVTITGGPADVIQPDGTSSGHPTSTAPKGSAPPSATTYAAIAGYPHLTVPMGLAEGLPVGLSFIGPAWSEQLLLSLGYAYEQASHARVPPTVYKTGLVESLRSQAASLAPTKNAGSTRQHAGH